MVSNERQQKFDDLCRGLAANRPDITTVDMSDYCYKLPDVLKLGEALRENSIVDELLFETFVKEDGVRGIADFISRSPSLRSLKVYSKDQAVVDQLLRAAGESGRIESLIVDNSPFGFAAFAAALQGLRTSLKFLRIHWVDRSFRMRQDEAAEDTLSNAVRGVTSLEKLELCDELRPATDLALPIVNGLVGHPCLKELTVYGVRPMGGSGAAFSAALGNVLVSRTPLERLAYKEGYLGFDRWSFEDHGLAAVLERLHEHETLREFTIHLADGSAAFTTCVGNMLRHNRSIEELDVYCNRIQVFPSILEPLVGDDANSTLKELTLTCWTFQDEDEEMGSCEGLISLVPEMQHLKKLHMKHMDHNGLSLPNRAKTDFVRAFERNLSLTSVKIDCLHRYIWIPRLAEEEKAVQYYAKRNAYRDRFASSSKTQLLLTDFQDLQTNQDDLTALSLMLETLRTNHNWIPSRIPPVVGRSSKKRRTSTTL